MAAGDVAELRYEIAEGAPRWWWLPLLTGVLWLAFSLVVFRFDLTSVSAVGTLVGIVFIVEGVEDLLNLGLVTGAWRWFYGILGFALIIGGIVAMAYPGKTFLILAAIVGWLLLFRGVFDLVLALTNRDVELWWIRLVTGIAQIALAVIVSGSLVEKAIFVLVFVGVSAMVRGILQIVFAFQIRSAAKAAA